VKFWYPTMGLLTPAASELFVRCPTPPQRADRGYLPWSFFVCLAVRNREQRIFITRLAPSESINRAKSRK
jgi:hypothetical protein